MLDKIAKRRGCLVRDVLLLDPASLTLEILALKAVDAANVQRLEQAKGDGAMVFPVVVVGSLA